MTGKTLATIERLLDGMTRDELRTVNKMLILKMKEQDFTLAHSFRVGQSVQFEGRHGLHKGRILRINARTIQIDCGVQGRWKVSPSFIKTKN